MKEFFAWYLEKTEHPVFDFRPQLIRGKDGWRRTGFTAPVAEVSVARIVSAYIWITGHKFSRDEVEKNLREHGFDIMSGGSVAAVWKKNPPGLNWLY